MRKFQFISTIVITFVFTFSFTIPVFLPVQAAAAEQTQGETRNLADISTAINKAVEKVIQSGISSEWEAVGIARSGHEVPSSYYENSFLSTLDSQVIQASRPKITDIERLVIGASAIVKDPTNVNGTNLVEKIYNSADRTPGTDSMTAQGINGPIFALIALDSQEFTIPANARWTKEKLLNELLSRQNADGSWSLFGTSPSYDMTAMALIALAPYKSQENVKAAIDRAVQFLSIKQGIEGGFSDPFVGGVSSETTSQVIIGLSSLGIDPTSSVFTKEGNNLVSHLLSFQHSNGGFKHIQSQNGSDGMATAQALQALVAYKLFLEGEGNLYQFPKKPVTMPAITVDGLEDGQTVYQEELVFTVAANDGEGKSIGNTVNVNNQDLPSKEDGKYTIKLNEGSNTITITAEDKRNNKTIQTFHLTYEKIKKDEINVTLSVQNGKAALILDDIDSLKDNGTVSVNLDSEVIALSIDKVLLGALKNKHAFIQFHVKNMAMAFPIDIFTTSDDVTINIEKLKSIEQAYSFIYDLSFVQNGKSMTTIDTPVKLSLNLMKGDQTAAKKLAIYYLNSETKKWEKIGGEYSEGMVTVNISRFSTFVVFNEDELPVAAENGSNNNGTTDQTDKNTSDKSEAAKNVEKGTSSTDSIKRNALPNTASQQWNLILLGAVLTIIGAAIYSRKRLRLKMNK